MDLDIGVVVGIGKRNIEVTPDQRAIAGVENFSHILMGQVDHNNTFQLFLAINRRQKS